MNMETYSLELVTPCFCAGSNQLKAEIRVPSIRGQVRWWLRAMGGSAAEEKRLFGGVHGGASASAVVMRVRGDIHSEKAVNLHDLVGRDQNHPQAYLLWPLRPTQRSEQKRGVLEEGSRFELLVGVHPRLNDPALAAKARAALELWVLLGGLGTRSRRGYGSLAPADGGPIPLPADIDALREQVASRVKTFGHPRMKVLRLSDPRDLVDDALNELGSWLKGYRAGSSRSGVQPKKWGRDDHDAGLGQKPHAYRPVIGLPLTQRYSDGRMVDWTFEENDRWASPVHLKVVKLGAKYLPVAVFFPGMAIPDGSRITLKPSVRRDRMNPFDVRLDHGLLEEMMAFGGPGHVLYE